MSDQIQYEPGLANVFLAIAKGEHLQTLHWPVPCPNCLSDDTKPVDETHEQFECTNCGEIFKRPA